LKYLVRKRLLLPLESASRNKYIVGIDRLRYNARVALGETVNISKINRIAANQITMRSLTAITMSKI
jgi:hypothetical protein